MNYPRMSLVRRALTASAVIAAAGSIVLSGAAPAGAHNHKADGCRAYPAMAHPYLKIEAEDNTFDADCLMAPANRAFRIYLMNNDADPHNISIYSADPSKDKKAEQLFKGRAVKGPGQEEYSVDALAPGTYFFRDDKVPGMSGSVEVPKK